MFEKNVNKVLIGLIIIILGVTLYWYLAVKDKQSKEVIVSAKQYLISSFVAELPEINKRLPHKIDQSTSLLSIQFQNEKVVSRYEISDQNVIDQIKKSTEQYKLHLKKQACLDNLKDKLLEVDVEFLDAYLDPKGNIIFDVSVNKPICTALTEVQ